MRKAKLAPAGLPRTLRQSRERLGLTLEEASKIIGTTKGTLSRVERGILDLRAESFVRACALYDLDSRSPTKPPTRRRDETP